MQALEGIALLNPSQPAEKIQNVLESLGAEYGREFSTPIPNVDAVWKKATEKLLLPLRCDLYRCLLFSGITSMGFAVDFRTIHDGDRMLLMRPIRKCVSHNMKNPFWPRTENKVPDEMIKTIRSINDSAIKWKRSLFFKESHPRPSGSQSNSSTPAVSTTAVQSEEIDVIRRPSQTKSVERRESVQTNFKEQEQVSRKTVEDAPEEVQTAITAEHYGIGAAVLIVLAYLTFRQ